MKLELKHLAPYLPHGLKCIKKETISTNNFSVRLLTGYNLKDCIDFQDKPIFRPLSDLYKNLPEHEEIMDEFSEYSWELFENAFLLNIRPENRFDFVSFSVAQLLFKHHFDLFDLIRDGQAIDINTLKK